MTVMRNYLLDFKIDKLTDSIINLETGEKYETVVSLVSEKDLASIKRLLGWNFNWKNEFRQADREIFKLCSVKNLELIQGLISLTLRHKAMGYIKEPEGIDLTIKSKPLSTQQEKELIDFITDRKLSKKRLAVKKGKKSLARI